MNEPGWCLLSAATAERTGTIRDPESEHPAVLLVSFRTCLSTSREDTHHSRRRMGQTARRLSQQPTGTPQEQGAKGKKTEVEPSL